MARARLKKAPKKPAKAKALPKRASTRASAPTTSRPARARSSSRRSVAAEPRALRAERAGRRPDRGVVVDNLRLDQQFQRIGGNLTPATVSSVICQADTGDVSRLIDLANEARQKDCHLHGVLQTREIGLSSTPWEIRPFVKRGRKEPRAKDRALAAWVEDSLKAIVGGPNIEAGASQELAGFTKLLAHLAGAVYYGFAVAEVVWGKVAGRLVPIGFNLISARRFIFDQADGRLKWRDEGFPKPIDILEEFPAGKFIVFQPRINGDVPCREGLVRPLMWAALFRNWDIRDWLSLAEIAWRPWRTGVYKKGANKEDIDHLYDALQRLTADGVGAFPDTTDFKIHWPANGVSSGQSMHGALAEFLAGEMSKAVLGQTLTTESGSRGARSLGEVHDKVRKDIAVFDATGAAACVMAMLVTPMVRLNTGTTTAVSEFTFVTETREEIKAFSEGVKNLQSAGTRISAKWVRERVGMPEPDEDEEILAPLPPAGTTPPSSDGEPKDPDADPSKEPEEKPEDDEEPAAAA
jgi:phage gp29-like protein